jgi:hypothetical protein
MVVVVLISAMRHGLKTERVQELRESLGSDRRTVERRGAWWLEHFVQSSFWKAARGRFLPRICQAHIAQVLAYGLGWLVILVAGKHDPTTFTEWFLD